MATVSPSCTWAAIASAKVTHSAIRPPSNDHGIITQMCQHCTRCAIIAHIKGTRSMRATQIRILPAQAIPHDEFAAQAGNPDFVLSLARGLRVIESFEGHHEGRSIVEISQSTGLSRASIRRLLLTLELLGYVERSRQVYRLKTQVLRLGFSYLSSSSVVEAARPVLERIAEQLHESSSMSMLDAGEIVYVARSAASRVLAAGLSVGSRLPAYCTSMGRVLLAVACLIPSLTLSPRFEASGLHTQNHHPNPPTEESHLRRAEAWVTPLSMKNWRLVCDPSPFLFLRTATGLLPPSTSERMCHASIVPRSSAIVCPLLQEGARSLRNMI